MLASVVARKAAGRCWSAVAGSTPKDDPELEGTSPGQAILWAGAVGASGAIARLLARRTAASVWKRTTSEPVPSP
jgi:hypothetical protein